ncbi:AAA family ATPase [Citrobacter rodentium]|uniref:AAA family ATPase n=2 Tax=Citrobacter rodentium TaxID=67825 RepID=A0A482PV63_CITRO|nr:AAA family ATPase [Citrobacter rodentium]EHG7584056.1 AAA family ATPase [Citrobacter sedlakii]UHO33487.1 AAA family ATPase [Citrobacter rodentium NBRC 105723 = DSM 16636]EHG7613704.1 AAA family ATPase [Citrobacter sedlakii]KIQ51675.1 ATPase AAA [Citrobacter rodentium]QBY32012.1 AAA family ATPase [Citrobacter rodentium]
MANPITKLKKINVVKFRGLKNINIEFGSRLTVICGKNGTSKSTILGIIAQIFSFTKDLSKNPEVDLTQYKTLTNGTFKSAFSEHFRLSEQFDTAGSMEVRISVYDGASNKHLEKLTLGLYSSSDRDKSRPIVRGNDSIPGKNQSRNVTHPVIFLSLARLLPITLRTDYSTRDVQYINENADDIRIMSNQLLLKNNGCSVTATKGTIDSMVVHGDNYDHQSVSVGEDNVGQLIQAIFSFKRLKELYDDYHGGILLIDEADAGLFPAAQLELIDILAKAAKKYDLQIIMTSHSPLIIEDIFNRSKQDANGFKTIYLTDTYGDIKTKDNLSWADINADLHVETVKINDEISLPKANVYFEDKEGFDFFKQLIIDRRINRILNPLGNINISCTAILDLMARKVPEFTNKSLVVLDGDVALDNSDNAKKAKKERSLCLLPGILPPDQMIFEFLYNLPPDDIYWNNKNRFTKAVFMKITKDIITTLKISNYPIDLLNSIENYKKSNKNHGGVVRKLFKDFVHTPEFLAQVKGRVKDNPYRYWVEKHPVESDNFKHELIKNLKIIMTNGHGVDSATITSYLSGN